LEILSLKQFSIFVVSKKKLLPEKKSLYLFPQNIPKIMPAPAWPEGVQVPTAGDESIASILVKFQQQYKIPGCAAAIVNSKGLVSAACAGWRKRGDTDHAVSLNDQWHLGSNTKMMTATLAAVFVEEGLINWETTVGEIFDNAPDAWQSVTLDHLLTHTSGATENIEWNDHDDAPNRDSTVAAIFKQNSPLNLVKCSRTPMLVTVSLAPCWRKFPVELLGRSC
jgi:CubicO group peptidase (beta-lactamase class C family)